MPRKKHPVGIGMAPSKTELGKFIRERRLKIGFTQQTLAKRIRIKQNILSAIEVGTREYIKEKLLKRLAEALNCDCADLSRLTPVKKSAQPKTERGKFIRSRREELGLTYSVFARRMKKSLAQAKHAELNKNPAMQYSTAKVMARALRIDLSVLSKFMTKEFKQTANKLGQLIRTRRKALGMSSGELARKTGTKPQMINQIEHGQCPLCESGKLIKRLTKALKLKRGVLEAVLPARKLKKVVIATPLGEFLSSRRIKLGLTLEKLSVLTQLNSSNLSIILRGKRNPKAAQLKRISQALKCRVPARLLRSQKPTK